MAAAASKTARSGLPNYPLAAPKLIQPYHMTQPLASKRHQQSNQKSSAGADGKQEILANAHIVEGSYVALLVPTSQEGCPWEELACEVVSCPL